MIGELRRLGRFVATEYQITLTEREVIDLIVGANDTLGKFARDLPYDVDWENGKVTVTFHIRTESEVEP